MGDKLRSLIHMGKRAFDTILANPSNLARPKRSLFHEQAPRSSAMEWTPPLIRQAERMADGGSLRLAAQLCDQIIADDRASGTLREVRIRGLLGLPIEFESPNKGGSLVDPLREDWWSLAPEDVLCEWMEWGILLGIGVGRATYWERVDQPSGVRLLPHRDDGSLGWEVIHPSVLRFDHDKKIWFARQKSGSEAEVIPGDGTWVVYTPYGTKRPWARGAYRSLSRWWLLKQYAISDWGRYSERHGQGTLVGSADSETPKQFRDELAADLQNLGRETSIALPPGYKLELIESTANTWETFQAQVEMANTAITIRILGQNLSTEVQGGSYAAAEIHKSVAASIIRSDDETSATILRAQLIQPWAIYNFGDARRAPWPKRDTTPPADTAALAKTYLDAAESLRRWMIVGAPVDKEEFARLFRMPMVEGRKWQDAIDPKGPTESLLKHLRLASGDDPSEASGAISGQAHVDAISNDAATSTAHAIESDVAQILDLIDEIEDGDDWPERLRSSIINHYKQIKDPTALESLVHKATILAELAGRAAVVEDL